ncbi:universal stress protein [Pontibacterium sp.]|uniref:universal stress protein n=2 Tax=Pontibacterium sp. TaxID=2036026 RepID=UPI0035173DCD
MYNSILIPIDLEHVEMFPRAVAVAKQLFGEQGGTIHSLYVDQNKVHSIAFTQMNHDLAKEMREEIKKRVADVFEANVPEEMRGMCHIRNGVVYDEILEEEQRLKPDVILIAAGRPGVTSYLLGSNAEKVLRHARSSVFVIRDSKIW